MKTLTAAPLLLLVFSITVLLVSAGNADNFIRARLPTFKSDAANKATERYLQSATTVSKRYVDELDRHLKIALQSNLLEEGNQIAEARKQASAGEVVTVDFKRPSLVASRNLYRDGLVQAKGQYFRDLEVALREVTKTGDLQEANSIDAVRKELTRELADGKTTGKIENGLVLTLGDKRSVWTNKAVKLPPNQTAVTFEGVLLLPDRARNIKLRSAQANGSERLKFTVDGKPCEFQMDGNHRYVIVEPQPGSDKVRLQLGNSIAANEWLFGPLEWSINDAKWREVPLRSMLASD